MTNVIYFINRRYLNCVMFDTRGCYYSVQLGVIFLVCECFHIN